MREVEIVIVGAGPAGLAAALEATEIGAQVVVIEEYHNLGGQFYRQMPEGFVHKKVGKGDENGSGAALLQRLRSAPVEVMSDTLVWGIFDERTVALYRNDHTEFLRPQKLILAPGAHEAPIAFPGWTLPGVMMGGAVQSLLMSQRIRPTHKVVLAGIGPFQLKVASQLVAAGVKVIDILDPSPKSALSMTSALHAIPHWDKIREGVGYWFTLKGARIPYHQRQVPVRGLGGAELQALVVAQVDDDWKVVPGTDRILETDLLCLSYGFIPSIQLARLAGCKLQFQARAGGWITWHDANQQTSIDNVYVAGEAGGIGGADVAAEEGRIAAFAAVRSLGRPVREEYRRQEHRARKRLISAKRFAEVVRDSMLLRPGLFDVLTDETIVCRCEEVTVRRVKDALVDGDATVRGAKVRTRAGMGRCQGRMCSSLIRQLISRETQASLSEVLLDTPRPPIKPVPIHALATSANR